MEARRRRSDEWRAWGTARIMGRGPPSLAGISNRRVVVGRDEAPRSDRMAFSLLVHARCSVLRRETPGEGLGVVATSADIETIIITISMN